MLVIFKIEKGENSQIFIYFHSSAFIELSKICIANNTVKKIFINVGGKPKMVPKALCEVGGVHKGNNKITELRAILQSQNS